jgi:hypothetical protein
MPTAMEAIASLGYSQSNPRESPRRCAWAVGPQATETVPALSFQAVFLQGPLTSVEERRYRALAQARILAQPESSVNTFMPKEFMRISMLSNRLLYRLA